MNKRKTDHKTREKQQNKYVKFKRNCCGI